HRCNDAGSRIRTAGCDQKTGRCRAARVTRPRTRTCSVLALGMHRNLRQWLGAVVAYPNRAVALGRNTSSVRGNGVSGGLDRAVWRGRCPAPVACQARNSAVCLKAPSIVSPRAVAREDARGGGG